MNISESVSNGLLEKGLQGIEAVLAFIVEIEKLKDVHRHTRPVGLERYENSAEHSWHVCLAALMLKDYADAPIDIDRVIKMLLIHDLGEIDVGDTIIYASETPELKESEAAGVKRILDLLPDGRGDEYMALWHEFEAGQTADSQYARAIDRVPPLLHNLHGGGHSWKKYSIPFDKVMGLNSRIAKGSEDVWSVLAGQLQTAKAEGLFDPQA